MAKPLVYSASVLVRLTAEQHATLDWLAEMTDKSKSEWVRWFIDQGTAVFGLVREMEEITCPTPNGCKESSSR